MKPIYEKPTEFGPKGAPLTVFLIHGYTATPDDFHELPRLLAEKLGVRVCVPLLPGHGTSIHDLDTIQYEDLTRYVEKEFEQELRMGKPVIVGGISLGALLALRLAMKYPVSGVMSINTPLTLKLPFSLPGIGILRFCKKYWKKRYLPGEVALRAGASFYQEMHINGLQLIKQGSREIQRGRLLLSSPLLVIHSPYDPIGGLRGVRTLELRLHNTPCEVVIYHNKNHNVFYSNAKDEAYDRIASFIEHILGVEDKLLKN